MTTMPARIEGDLYEAAKATGAAMSRSAAQQLNHWARIGREFEGSPGVSQRDVARVLAGRLPYDSLNEAEQSVVRVGWDEQMSEIRDGLDFAAEFESEGVTDWVGAAPDGSVVVGRDAGSTVDRE